MTASELVAGSLRLGTPREFPIVTFCTSPFWKAYGHPLQRTQLKPNANEPRFFAFAARYPEEDASYAWRGVEGLT